jgi:hypothetical protein
MLPINRRLFQPVSEAFVVFSDIAPTFSHGRIISIGCIRFSLLDLGTVVLTQLFQRILCVFREHVKASRAMPMILRPPILNYQEITYEDLIRH